MSTPKKVIDTEGKPVSLYSLRARKRQATKEPFVFDVDGEYFTLRNADDADWLVTADAGQNLRDFMKELLADDWERFSKLQGISNADIAALLEEAAKHYQGATRGE